MNTNNEQQWQTTMDKKRRQNTTMNDKGKLWEWIAIKKDNKRNDNYIGKNINDNDINGHEML